MSPAHESAGGDARFDADVVVVGGGPVGMGLAIELGQRGVRCVVVERHAQPQPIPKGQNLTQRTMEHFRAWGAEERLRQARTIPRGHGIGGLTAYGTLLSGYAYDWLQRDLVQPYYHAANERLPQYRTEAVLRQRAAELPAVDVRYGWDATAVAQDGEGVQVTLVQRGDERVAHVLRGRYAVGCDGSRSVVRRSAGIAQTRTDHDRLMVLLVFRSRGLDGLLGRHAGKSYFSILHPQLQGYWKFFGRVDLEGTWFFHAPVPPGTTQDNFDFRAFLGEAAGAAFDVDLQHVGFWDLRFAVATRYRAGRLFIAGDAAHSHPPYGGYGLNAGLEDARNLGWKLAAVRQGWGGEALLDAYDAERRPVFESTARDFIARSIEIDRDFVRDFDPARDRAAFEQAWQARSQAAVAEVHAFEPHYEGSPVVERGAHGGACSARGEHRFEARSGHHLAPAVLGTGGPVADALGPGFTLLAFGQPEAATQPFAAAAAALGVPLAVVADDAAGEAAARYAARWVLVRPDGFVAWARAEEGVPPGTAERVLRQSCGLAPVADAAASDGIAHGGGRSV